MKPAPTLSLNLSRTLERCQCPRLCFTCAACSCLAKKAQRQNISVESISSCLNQTDSLNSSAMANSNSTSQMNKPNNDFRRSIRRALRTPCRSNLIALHLRMQPHCGGRRDAIVRLAATGHLPNCTQLAARFRVTTKTIARDLEQLHDEGRINLTYDERAHSYRSSFAPRTSHLTPH